MEVLTPEQQVQVDTALDAYDNSQQVINSTDPITGIQEGIPDGFNADGTPIEQNLILDKFKSQEELVEAYKALETQLGDNKSQEPTVPDNDTATSTFDINKFDEEFRSTGSLSDESYEALSKQGFNREQVDRYIKGQTALAESYTKNIYDTVGGQDAYTNLIQWASTNIPQETVVEYNEALKNGNISKVTQLLEYMNMKAGTTVEKAPTRIQGVSTSNPTGTIKAFANKSEWMIAAQNPLYNKDSKYTAMVQNKYLASKQAGLI